MASFYARARERESRNDAQTWGVYLTGGLAESKASVLMREPRKKRVLAGA